MTELTLSSQIILFPTLFFMGILAVIIFIWQWQVLKGNIMKNADGSVDSWEEQKIFYGIAFADILVACPLTLISIVLIFVLPGWGYQLLALVSFWFVWTNIMTTVTSIRFENPKFSLYWFIQFPFGLLLGIVYLIWFLFHIKIIITN